MSDSFERMLVRKEDDEQPAETQPASAPAPLGAWLDQLEARRDALIMELRGIDKTLIEYGRLKQETIPRRNR